MSRKHKSKIKQLQQIFFDNGWQPTKKLHSVKYITIFGEPKTVAFHNREDALTFACQFGGALYYKHILVGDYNARETNDYGYLRSRLAKRQSNQRNYKPTK